MKRIHLLSLLLVICSIGSGVHFVWPYFELIGSRASILIALLGAAALLLSLFPALYPAYRHRMSKQDSPWALQFVLLVASVSYGLPLFVVLVLGPPIEFFLLHMAPQLQAIGEPIGGPFYEVAAFVSTYWWVAMTLVVPVASVLLTRYLLPRWSAVVSALRG